MPKISFSQDTFTDLDIYTQKVQTRYRISTDDKNATSYWSPIYLVDPMFFFTRGNLNVPGSMTVEKVGSNIRVVWSSVALYKNLSSNPISELPYYDVWIRWADTAGANPGEWIYRQRTSATSIDLIVPEHYVGTTAPKYVYVEVYRPGKPIQRYEEAITFTQNSTYINTTNDTIKIPSGYRYCTGSKIQYISSTPITGLTSTSIYYIRVIDYYTFSLHPTQQDAVLNLNKINLSGTPSGTGQIIGKPFLMYYGETNF